MDSQKRTEAYHKSRLGQILVNKGYLSPEKLEQIVDAQSGESDRLGEMLVKRRLLSRWQLRRALSSQTRTRFAASVSVILLAEIQKLLAEDDEQSRGSPIYPFLKPLLISERLGSNVDIHYDPVQSKAEIKMDGSIQLKQISSVGEFLFTGLRLNKGPGEGYEHMKLSDIDFSRADISLRGYISI